MPFIVKDIVEVSKAHAVSESISIVIISPSLAAD